MQWDRTSGIPVSEGTKGWHARAQTILELFRTYSIPEDLLGNPSLLFGMDTVVDKLLPFSTSFRLKSCIMDSAQKVSSLEDMFVHGEIEQATTVQCYHVTSATKPTESLDWKLNDKRERRRNMQRNQVHQRQGAAPAPHPPRMERRDQEVIVIRHQHRPEGDANQQAPEGAGEQQENLEENPIPAGNPIPAPAVHPNPEINNH